MAQTNGCNILASFSLSQDINQLSGGCSGHSILELDSGNGDEPRRSPRTDHLDGGSAQVDLKVK